MFVAKLYDLSIKAIAENYDLLEDSDILAMPDMVLFDVIISCFRNDNVSMICNRLDVDLFYRLFIVEHRRHELMKMMQAFIDDNFLVCEQIYSSYVDACESMSTCDNSGKKHELVNKGVQIGKFFQECGWYNYSEKILLECWIFCKRLKLTDFEIFTSVVFNCGYELLNILTIYQKLDRAEDIFNYLIKFNQEFPLVEIGMNRSIINTLISKYFLMKHDYSMAYKWAMSAVDNITDSTPLVPRIETLCQACISSVLKRKLVEAKSFIRRALKLANTNFPIFYYKWVDVLSAYGTYLIHSDSLRYSVVIHKLALKIAWDTFGRQNLKVAVVQADLAYSIYVHQYNYGHFSNAWFQIRNVCDIFKSLLPEENLMLHSANRVMALILEEMALDSVYVGIGEIFIYVEPGPRKHFDVMMEEAEKLHKDALAATDCTLGEGNAISAKIYGNLGRLYQSMKKYSESEEMHLKAIKMKEELYGDNDYEVALSLGYLASLYNYDMKRYKEAEALYLRAIEINLKLFSPSYTGLEYDYKGLISVYVHLNQFDDEYKYQSKLEEWSQLRAGSTNEDTLIGLNAVL